MCSDPTPPPDSTPPPAQPKPDPTHGWLPGETYFFHLQRMTQLAAYETKEEFQKAFLANDTDDPAMFVFMDTMYQMINNELQFQAKQMKEALKRQKDSFTGKE